MRTNIQEIIKVLTKAGLLKEVKRTGWILKGIKNPESVAEHTWRMGLIIMFLANNNKKLDKRKLLEMNTIHDLGEIGIGDVKWESGRRIIGSQNIKHKDEIKTLEKLFKNIPHKNRYLNLLKEFNDQKTPEAKFLKLVDKLEMVLQAYDYQKKGYPREVFEEFWENAKKYLEKSSLEPFFRELEKLAGRS